jgi:ATP-binding cassette, subfamily C (CFTR/MRP), member 1
MCIIKLIIICVIGKYLTGSIPVFGVIVYFVQSFYLRTSRQMRLLDIEAKAPLYGHFLETIEGISTLRAFNWQSKFREENEILLSASQKPAYMLYSIQQWLTLILNLVVGAMAVTLVAIVTSVKGSFNAASIGVALNFVLDFNLQLSRTIKMWTLTEISIGAVARVQRFVENTPSEEIDPATAITVSSSWPSRGYIQFRTITANYKFVVPIAISHSVQD